MNRLGWVLIFAGLLMIASVTDPIDVIGLLVLFAGIVIVGAVAIEKRDRYRRAHSGFLLLPQNEAQKFIDSLVDPRQRTKLANDWRQHHTSTKL